MKKIVIIGGGIAGLSAGIFAQKYGFESEIFESHSIVGGECTGWNRDGFHIDNCIHWMTGTKSDTSLYKLWEEVGALGKDIEIIKPDKFYTSYVDGKSVSLYRDTEKTRKELLEISPEDKDEINSFIDAVKAAECINMPADMPMDMMPKMQMMKLGMSMMGVLKYMKKYGGITIKQFCESFKSPVLRTFFRIICMMIIRHFRLLCPMLHLQQKTEIFQEAVRLKWHSVWRININLSAEKSIQTPLLHA